MKGKTKAIIAVAVAAVLAIGVGAGWYLLYEKPHSEAVAAFKEASATVAAKNAELEAAIESTKVLVESGEVPLTPTVLTDAETAVTVSRSALRVIPDMSSNTDEIVASVATLKEPLDYSAQISDLDEKRKTLEDSIAQMKQVTNPSEAFVVERLQGISTITGVSAVTEDNDPNGKLNKQGGYTACVYFSDSKVNQEDVSGDTIIGKGTMGGGGIEVYSSVEDAQARNTYLAAFDGGILSSGSHEVIGTVVVRTSDKLTATQQSDLTAAIISNLVELR